jgi:hypothetical protein
MKTRFALVLLAFALPPLFAPGTLVAAPRTFTGGGADTNWNTSANWNPAGAPTAADTLVFVAGVIASNNNLSGATFHDFDFNARHTLTGNPFTLTHGMSASPLATRTATISQNFTLGADQTFNVVNGTLACNGMVALNGKVLTAMGAGTLVLAQVSGTGVSRIVKNEGGTLRISTIAVNASGIMLNDGTLDVAGIVTGPITMNAGRLIGTGQCQGLVTATGGEIAPTGGDLSFANTLNLSSAAKVIVSLTGPGAENLLEVTGGSVDLNNAELVIDTSAYQPVWDEDFTLLTKTTAGRVSGDFKDLPQGAEVRLNDTTVGRISYTGGNGNDIVLDIISTTRTWDGGNTINDNWNEAENWSGNTRPNFGDVLVFPAGIQSTDRGVDNNFPNDTTFRQLIFGDDGFTVRGNRFKLTHGLRIGFSDGQVNLDTDVFLALDQTFDLGEVTGQIHSNNYNRLHLDALDQIDTGGRRLSLQGKGGYLDGKITGTGSVQIIGGAELWFGQFADSADPPNSYTGETVIEPTATLHVDEDQALGSTTGPTIVRGTLEVEVEGLQDDRTLNEPFVLHAGGVIGSRGEANFVTSGKTTNKFLGSLQLVSPSLSMMTLRSIGHDSTVLAKHEYHGTISGIGGLVVVGHWTVAGSTHNTNTGCVSFDADELKRSVILKKSAPGITALSAADIYNNGQNLIIEQDEQISNAAHVHLSLGGDLILGEDVGRHETIGQLTMAFRSSVTGASGAQLVVGGIEVVSSDSGTHAVLSVPVAVQETDLFLHCNGPGPHVPVDLEVTEGLSGAAGRKIRRSGNGRVSFADNLSVTCELNNGVTIFNGTSGSSGIVHLNGGTVAGTGTVGNLVSLAGGGRVQPGPHDEGTGRLNCRTLSWNDLSHFDVKIRSAGNSDQLSAQGGVSLGGARLNVDIENDVPRGTRLVILSNDGTDPIVGTFAAAPEGAFIDERPTGWFTISYHGGDGNDVALTRATGPAATPELTRVSFSNGTGPGGVNQVSLSGLARPGALFGVETSTDLMNWTFLQDLTADSAGEVTVTIDVAPGAAGEQFFRLPP